MSSSLTESTGVWVPVDTDEVYVGAQVISSSDSVNVVRIDETGEEKEVKRTVELLPRNPREFEGIDDLIKLQHLHEAAILHNLKLRYNEDKIYTFTGPILIAVNPWKRLPLYDAEHMKPFKGKALTESPPHLFAIADAAYRSMVKDKNSQSILVSGESGAGKTESTKYLMQYLVNISGRSKVATAVESSGSDPLTPRRQGTAVEQQVLQSNPLLEAFGNAKTLRNDNSSRFGKFIQIFFDDTSLISGAAIDTYLLEKSRLVSQAIGERNYHIFYQLCAGATPEEREELQLLDMGDYFFLNQSECFELDGVSDRAQFVRTRDAMDYVGLDEDQHMTIFRLLSGILRLGNVDFVIVPGHDDISAVRDPEELSVASQLLRVDVGALDEALCKRKIATPEGEIVVNSTVDQAADAREALSKALYGRLFTWLVGQINANMRNTGGKLVRGHHIGILDIFGFESFELNSFEQLCINYANEKLQQQFNQFVFKLEQEEYKREQIPWEYIEFLDNQPCLDLLEERPRGVFPVLDEECMVPRGSDDGFASKLFSHHKQHGYFEKAKIGTDSFIVRHYAGPVCYTVTGFLEKNKDQLFEGLKVVCSKSTDPFIASLFKDVDGEGNGSSAGAAPGGRAGGRARAGAPSGPVRKRTMVMESVSSQFKQQLTVLVSNISQTRPYYVRCVNPNGLKRSALYIKGHVLHQLRCGGVMEAVKVTRAGFPSRYKHADFLARYGLLFPPELRRASGEARDTVLRALRHLALDDSQFRVGLTKVFFRLGQMEDLEKRRMGRLGEFATKVQTCVRRVFARRRFVRLRAAAIMLQAGARGRAGRRVYRARLELVSAQLLQRNIRMYVKRAAFNRLRRGALLAQSAVRGRRARAVYAEMVRHHRAAKLQSAFRRMVAARAFLRLRRGAVAVQCCWRRVRAKRELKQLRIEARQVGTLEVKARQLEEKSGALEREVASLRAQLADAQASGGGDAVASSHVLDPADAQLLEQAKNLVEKWGSLDRVAALAERAESGEPAASPAPAPDSAPARDPAPAPAVSVTPEPPSAELRDLQALVDENGGIGATRKMLEDARAGRLVHAQSSPAADGARSPSPGALSSPGATSLSPSPSSTPRARARSLSREEEEDIDMKLQRLEDISALEHSLMPLFAPEGTDGAEMPIGRKISKTSMLVAHATELSEQYANIEAVTGSDAALRGLLENAGEIAALLAGEGAKRSLDFSTREAAFVPVESAAAPGDESARKTSTSEPGRPEESAPAPVAAVAPAPSGASVSRGLSGISDLENGPLGQSPAGKQLGGQVVHRSSVSAAPDASSAPPQRSAADEALIEELKKEVELLREQVEQATGSQGNRDRLHAISQLQAFRSSVQNDMKSATADFAGKLEVMKVEFSNVLSHAVTAIEAEIRERESASGESSGHEVVKLREQVQYLQSSVQELTREVDRKKKIIMHYQSRDAGGILSNIDVYQNTVPSGKARPEPKRKPRLSIFGRGTEQRDEPAEASTEDKNKKLEAALEDTVIHNIRLKSDLRTMGEEVDKLMSENKELKALVRQAEEQGLTLP